MINFGLYLKEYAFFMLFRKIVKANHFNNFLRLVARNIYKNFAE